MNNNKPSWAQNPVQHSNEHYRVSDAELQRKVNCADEKERHHWQKPNWALSGETVKKNDTKPVDTSSIKRPMLKTTAASEQILKSPEATAAEMEALQRRLAQAKLDAAAKAEAAKTKDPTEGMTPEQKAKYEADQRLEALRIQTEERELQAWKQHQAERTEWERQRREEARLKAIQEKKQRDAEEKAAREKQKAFLKAEQDAQKCREAEIAAHRKTDPAQVSALEQQIADLKRQLEAAGASPEEIAAVALIQTPTTPNPTAKPIVIQQKKHGWSKPGWALPDETLAQESGIVTDSLQTGLKAPNTGGYERKVFAKELAPPPVKGKFVKNVAAKKPDPRMVWVVININGTKRGKIVMHLYGNVEAIVDKFFELKGLELKRDGNNQVFCDEMEPHFYLFGGNAAQVQSNVAKNSNAVYGVVLEGHDVLQLAQNSSADSVLSIRQSHIFPVKRAKS